MRGIPILLIGAALGSCTTAPQPFTRTPGAQQTLDSMITGKVAAPPINCLPSFQANDMSTIDARTLAFRSGSSTTYIMHLSDGCGELGTPGRALLTRQFGNSGLCRGDIAQVVDTTLRMPVGSCVIGDIVPYTRPKG